MECHAQEEYYWVGDGEGRVNTLTAKTRGRGEFDAYPFPNLDLFIHKTLPIIEHQVFCEFIFAP